MELKCKIDLGSLELAEMIELKSDLDKLIALKMEITKSKKEVRTGKKHYTRRTTWKKENV